MASTSRRRWRGSWPAITIPALAVLTAVHHEREARTGWRLGGSTPPPRGSRRAPRPTTRRCATTSRARGVDHVSYPHSSTGGCSMSDAGPAGRRRRWCGGSASRRSPESTPPRGCWSGSAPSFGSEFPDVQVELRTEDVMEMGVPDGEFDAVLCAMALHWFADKAAAVARMARALRPGGVLGILMVGRGGEDSWRELLERVERAGGVDRLVREESARRRRDRRGPRRRQPSSPSTSGWSGGGATRTRTRSWPAPAISRPASSATRPAVTASWTNRSRRRNSRNRPQRVRLRLLQALRGGAQAPV